MRRAFNLIETMICICIVLIIAGFAGPALIERSRASDAQPQPPQPTLEATYNWPDSQQSLGCVIRLPTGERMFVSSDGKACLLPPFPVETPK